MFEYLVKRGSQTSSALSLWSVVRESWQKYTTHMSCGGLRCTAPHNGLFLHRRKGAVVSPFDRYIVAIMGAENVGHGMNYAAVGGSAVTGDVAPRQD